MEFLAVILTLTRGAKHNDPQNPDPKGDHWTVELVKEGEFVTKRHVYPEDEKWSATVSYGLLG